MNITDLKKKYFQIRLRYPKFESDINISKLFKYLSFFKIVPNKKSASNNKKIEILVRNLGFYDSRTYENINLRERKIMLLAKQ